MDCMAQQAEKLISADDRQENGSEGIYKEILPLGWTEWTQFIW